MMLKKAALAVEYSRCHRPQLHPNSLKPIHYKFQQ